MKTNLKRITTFFACLLLAALLLTACASTDDGAAYFQVEKGLQWKSIYQVGETLSLNGLTAKYFRDIDSDDYETVTLKEDMITGFDTSKEGSFTMTVTYKGKTDTVSYTVVSKATPFEVIQTFCLAENKVVSIDSTVMKATVLVFDNYFKAVENQPSKTVETSLSFLVNNKGKTCASFEYNGSRYDLFYDEETNRYSMLTSSASSSSVGTTERLVYPINLASLPLPQKNVSYQSTPTDGAYYSIQIDDSYHAVVKKHKIEGAGTVDTVLDSFAATDTVLSSNGLFKYVLSKDGYTATATMSNQGPIQVRKEADGALESIYSALCSPSK